jgi:hypothetical protein
MTIGPDSHAITADGGTAAIVEGNRVFEVGTAVYHDTWSTRDLLIRNNFFSAVNFGVHQNLGGHNPKFGSALVYVGNNQATFTTIGNHNFNIRDQVTVRGALINLYNPSQGTNPYDHPQNPYNGTFPVVAKTSNSFTFQMLGAPPQYYPRSSADGGSLAYINALGSPVFQGPSQTFFIATSLTRGGSGNRTATFVSSVAHGFAAGDVVYVFGVLAAGTASNPFNGVFQVASVPNSTSITYNMIADPGADAATSPTPMCVKQDLSHPMFSATSLMRGGVGNSVATFVTSVAHGFSQDDVVSIFGVLAAGTFFNPFNGVYRVDFINSTTFSYNMPVDPGADAATSPAPMCGKQVATPLTANGQTATLNTIGPHGLSVGQGVVVADAIDVPLQLQQLYNGTFPVASVPSATSFTYQMAGTPSNNASRTPDFGALYQVGRLVMENNVIELVPNIIHNGYGPPAGVFLGGASYLGTVFVFDQIVVRNNIIRHVDDVADPPDAQFYDPGQLDGADVPYGIILYGCKQITIEDNIIDTRNSSRRILFNNSSQSVECFNNATSAGVLVRGYNDPSGMLTSEIATTLDDVNCLAI